MCLVHRRFLSITKLFFENPSALLIKPLIFARSFPHYKIYTTNHTFSRPLLTVCNFLICFFRAIFVKTFFLIFQLALVGVRGVNDSSDIAVDDVSMTQNVCSKNSSIISNKSPLQKFPLTPTDPYQPNSIVLKNASGNVFPEANTVLPSAIKNVTSNATYLCPPGMRSCNSSTNCISSNQICNGVQVSICILY